MQNSITTKAKAVYDILKTEANDNVEAFKTLKALITGKELNEEEIKKMVRQLLIDNPKLFIFLSEKPQKR